MVCLETDFLVALMRKRPDAVRKFLELERKQDLLQVTPISAAELFHGAFKSKNAGEVEKSESVLSLLEFLQFDFLSARHCGETMALLDRKGHVGDLDELTGSICVRYGQTLLTRNVKHFSKIKGLKIESW
jgi:tRNA(fMet)-specific endonuclease VapC